VIIDGDCTLFPLLYNRGGVVARKLEEHVGSWCGSCNALVG
jgi:hypothetical protein